MNRRIGTAHGATLPLITAVLILSLALPAATADEISLPDFCSSYPQTPGPGQWQSEFVYYAEGRLVYKTDSEQNRIPDYSYAGYGYGIRDIPTVPEVARLGPEPGDNTARIQQALDELAERPANAEGWRGALLLAPGEYEVRGTLRVRGSGVVLRGSGDGGDAAGNTILRGTGNSPRRRAIVSLGSGDTNWREGATRTEIATALVPVGSLTFDVEDATGFAVGDLIVVRHPSTRQWIDAVDGGGVVRDRPWRPGQIDIVYLRRIANISNNTITLDAPVYNHLDRALSPSYIVKATWNPVTQSGVENLRIDIETAGGDDEDHAYNGLEVRGAEDCWVRQVTALHFVYAGVRLEGAVKVTVEDCQALDPVARRTGARMYNFSNDRRTQLILFKQCTATQGRHGYISNGVSSSSGIVYYRCRATSGGGSEGGHRMWVTGVLYDNLIEDRRGQALLINRGDFGTSLGWGAAHSTIWRYNSELVVQKPPTAQNYGVTDAGHYRPRFYAPGAAGVQEQQEGELVPSSLYEAQLCERLKDLAEIR